MDHDGESRCRHRADRDRLGHRPHSALASYSKRRDTLFGDPYTTPVIPEAAPAAIREGAGNSGRSPIPAASAGTLHRLSRVRIGTLGGSGLAQNIFSMR